MNLSKEIFWDVDYSKLDFEKSANWVICRVLEYGGIKEWKEVKQFYGIDKIINAATNARSLSRKNVNFIHIMYNVPLTKFKCYNSNLSDPIHWLY